MLDVTRRIKKAGQCVNKTKYCESLKTEESNRFSGSWINRNRYTACPPEEHHRSLLNIFAVYRVIDFLIGWLDFAPHCLCIANLRVRLRGLCLDRAFVLPLSRCSHIPLLNVWKIGFIIALGFCLFIIGKCEIGYFHLSLFIVNST